MLPHRLEVVSGLRFISLVVALAVHLNALDIPCPAEPESVDELEPWRRFLEKLLPLAELGRLEQALTLRDCLAGETGPKDRLGASDTRGTREGEFLSESVKEGP